MPRVEYDVAGVETSVSGNSGKVEVAAERRHQVAAGAYQSVRKSLWHEMVDFHCGDGYLLGYSWDTKRPRSQL